MSSVLEILARRAGLYAFLLLTACGLGLPPWSEEVVLLGTGYFVAAGSLGFVAACLWCLAGILAGDSLLYALGRRVGVRIYRWPLLRRHLTPRRQIRLNRMFQRHGNKAVFLARFIPGYRLAAYFMAGNLGMGYGRFLALDVAGAAITVPPILFLGRLFAENLSEAARLLRRLEVPAALLAAGILALLLRGVILRRRRRLDALRQERARRGACGADPGGRG